MLKAMKTLVGASRWGFGLGLLLGRPLHQALVELLGAVIAHGLEAEVGGGHLDDDGQISAGRTGSTSKGTLTPRMAVNSSLKPSLSYSLFSSHSSMWQTMSMLLELITAPTPYML